MLHLDDDLFARLQPGPVHLPDRSRGQGHIVEVVEQFLHALAKFLLDRLAYDFDRIGRHFALKLRQLFRHRESDLVGPRAENLPQLDERRP